MMNVARSNLDSNELPEAEITRIRRKEAEGSAEVIGAVYHPPIVDDMMIFYDDSLLRQMSAVIREIRPTIVLLPSLNDYMEDHTNTARLVVSACSAEPCATTAAILRKSRPTKMSICTTHNPI